MEHIAGVDEARFSGSTSRIFQALPSSLSSIRTFVRDRATEAGVAGEPLDDLILAVSEACANTLLHTASPTIEVSWASAEDSVELVVRDEGVFGARGTPFLPDRLGGYGLPLMNTLVDEVDVRPGTEREPGTSVRLVKRNIG